MTVMARDREYDDLLNDVRGRRVLVWTCNTCARLCNIGGKDAGERLASRLAEDGVDTAGCVCSSAACFMTKADRMASEVDGEYDLRGPEPGRDIRHRVSRQGGQEPSGHDRVREDGL